MKARKFLVVATALAMLVLPLVGVAAPAKAAEMADGTWSRSSSTDTITITLGTALDAGDYIYLTWNQGSDDVASSVDDATVDGTAATVAVDETDNSAKITVPTGGASGSTVIAGTFLGTFDSTSYAQHSVAVNTTESDDTADDFGVAVTVTDLNDNTVDVTATVPLFINMSLSDVNMDLGVLNTASVNTDSHTIGVNTNDEAGYMIQVKSDGTFNDGQGNDIDAITEDGTVTAGTEGYGIAVAAGNSATELGDFTDDDTPLPTSATNFISYDEPASSHSHTVTYRAAIDGSTVAGTYSQEVTYTIATQSV